QDLAADRQDRLDPWVPAALGGAAGRVTLDDEDLALLGVGRLAVAQLARQSAAAEQTLAVARGLAGLPGRDPGDRRGLALADDHLALGRVLLEPVAEGGVHCLLDERAGLGVAQLRLRLTLELRLLELDRDDRGQTLPDVVTGELVL